ncbi:MAG: YncE family protein [Ginsengibacter sp.]
MSKILSITLVLVLLFSTDAICQDKDDYKLVKTYHIASPGWWDYIAVNNNKLYVSHGTQVNILDEKTGDSIGIIPNTDGVHGIAFDNELNHGYTSNGRANNVTVFDLTTNAIITQIVTGQNPDAIYYEPFSKKIITNNGRSNDLSVIDPLTNKVITTIDVGGKPEEAVSDGNGNLYVNIEDKNQVVAVNLNTFKVENRWSILPGEAPTGLAIDSKTKRLFAGCGDNKLLMVIDATNGKVVGKIPIGDGCDGVAFDKDKNLIFTSNGEGTITVIKEKSANEFKVKQTIITKRGARTITIDQNTHTLFLPTADFEPLDSNAPKGTRPKMIAGSFQVLVVK